MNKRFNFKFDKKVETIYLVIFFLSVSCFCYSSTLFKESQNIHAQGVSWHCFKCNRHCWKRDPPYKCNVCGAPRGQGAMWNN